MNERPPAVESPRPADDPARPMVVFLCTGNAARSVMASALLRARLGDAPAVSVSSGGTHALPGHVMSVRTRTALERLGLRDPHHRSHQLAAPDIERAALIVVMESDHLQWMRRTHPQGASITGSLRRIVRDLAPPGCGSLEDRVAGLSLEALLFEDWEEIVDPGGGEQPEFDAAAEELSRLVETLHGLLV